MHSSLQTIVERDFAMRLKYGLNIAGLAAVWLVITAPVAVATPVNQERSLVDVVRPAEIAGLNILMFDTGTATGQMILVTNSTQELYAIRLGERPDPQRVKPKRSLVVPSADCVAVGYLRLVRVSTGDEVLLQCTPGRLYKLNPADRSQLTEEVSK